MARGRAAAVAGSARAAALTLLLVSCGGPDAPAPDPDEVLPPPPGFKVTNRLAAKSLIKINPKTSTARKSWATIFTNGPTVDHANYRWQVALQFALNGSKWQCGGILITRQFILTAAHCVDPRADDDFTMPRLALQPDQISAWFGSDRFGLGTPLRLDDAWGTRVHKSYKKTGVAYDFDAALIRLAEPLKDAVPAPVRSVETTTGAAVVSGWGAFAANSGPSDLLRASPIQLSPQQACAADLATPWSGRLTGNMVCGASLSYDVCHGDSGGPLVVGKRDSPQTVGVVSWGEIGVCLERSPTGMLIGVYTKSAAIAQWVKESTLDPASVTGAAPGPTFPVGSGTFEKLTKETFDAH